MKANKRAMRGHRTHAQEGDYKIPYHDRKAFMGANVKWVDKKKYDRYIEWKKRKT
jgi:hypothetical protein